MKVTLRDLELGTVFRIPMCEDKSGELLLKGNSAAVVRWEDGRKQAIGLSTEVEEIV